MTALVATPIALYLFWQGGNLFAASMLLLALAAWFEYVVMMKQKSLTPLSWIGGGLVLTMVASAWISGLALITPLAFAGLSITLSLTVLNYKRFFIQDALYNLFGVLYVAIPFAHFIALRLMPDGMGMNYFAMAMLGTWACDTAAYFGGTRWGRHKLCPPVSPAKSVEGALFGFIGCIITIVIAGEYFGLTMTDRIFCGGVVGVFVSLAIW